MTLDEHIDFAKNKSKHLFESAYEEKDTLIACVYGKEALISGEVADLLEELKTLRKAFELACWELGENRGDTKSWRDDILEEVKKDNEDKT